MKPFLYYVDLIDGRMFFSIFHDIFSTYKYINVKNKTVLDVGADFGFSPLFFIKEGAESVIAYSLDFQLFGLRNKKIKFHRKPWDGLSHNALIGKFDCEGCEYITPVRWYFNAFESCYLAIHDRPMYHEQFLAYKKELDSNKNAKLIFTREFEWMYLLNGDDE